MDTKSKSITIEVVEKKFDLSERSITSYISKTTVDRGRDIVNPKGLNEKNYRKNPIVLFNHDYDKPIGKNLWNKKESDGVLAKTQFATTLFADDIMLLNKEGVLNAWSIGFIPEKWTIDEKQEVMTFDEWELLEYSSVSVPMNPDAINNAYGMVKSDLAQNYFKQVLEENEIKKDLASMKDEIEKLKSVNEELKKLLEKDDLSDLEKAEKNILELQNEIEKIKKKMVGTLGNEKLLTEIAKQVTGDVSR